MVSCSTFLYVVDHYYWRIWHRGRSPQEQMYGKCNNIQESSAIAVIPPFDACRLGHGLGPPRISLCCVTYSTQWLCVEYVNVAKFQCDSQRSQCGCHSPYVISTTC